MEFDINFIWGILLGAVIASVIWFLKTHKKMPSGLKAKDAKRGTSGSVALAKAYKALLRTKRGQKVDDTPPPTEWPDATYKTAEQLELDKAIARGDTEKIKELFAKVQPKEAEPKPEPPPAEAPFVS
jgi:hypothetical protein